ncbi:DUF167 family protein [Maritalea sp.]|uniref:DUF167 family protein n=1 Tax=Maritalea sp. TaxID=2003361 RepID=UPI003EF0DB64
MTNDQAWRQISSGLEVFVRVTPNANKDQVGKVELRDNGEAYLALRVRAVPDKGQANKAVIALFAKHFGLRKSDIDIVRGQQGRQKTLSVKSNDDDMLITQLEGLSI